MPKPQKKPRLALVTSNTESESALRNLADPEQGPLAEAEAIAEALNIAAVDDSQISPPSLATLSTMLCARLDQVRGVVEDHLAGTGGAA